MLIYFVLQISFLFSQNPILTYSCEDKTEDFKQGKIWENVKGRFVEENVCGKNRKVYQFEANQGFKLNITDKISSVYSIEMVLKLSEVESYARILDFKGLSGDLGVYARASDVVFYTVTESKNLRLLRPNAWFHLMVTRNPENICSAYVNGKLAFSFKDTKQITYLDSPLTFFDDDGTESRAGALAMLKIYNQCLSESAVVSKADAVCLEKKVSSTVTVKGKGQYYEYRFNNNFTPENNQGPSLQVLGTGNFSTETFGNCGTKGVYHFDKNCGFTFNNQGFIKNAHTIELFFKFDELKSWKRIVDYKNRTSDTGPYAFDNQIEFYKVAISKNFPFRSNAFSHVVLVRSEDEYYRLYVDGLLRASFLDNNELGIISKEDKIHFFRDDLQVPDECASGSITFLRIYNYALSDAQIAEQKTQMPCPKSDVVMVNKPIIVDKPVVVDTPKVVVIDKPKIIVYSLTGTVINEKTKESLLANVQLKPKNQKNLMDSMARTFTRTLPEGVYELTASSPGFLPYQQDVMLMKGNIALEIKLQKIEIGTKLTLQNIYFEANSAKLTVESYPSLVNLANYLKLNRNLTVRINGHTDNGLNTTTDYLLKLSEDRAQSVVSFLVKNGVTQTQISGKGFGSTKPISDNNTPEGRAQNRRVECEIIGN